MSLWLRPSLALVGVLLARPATLAAQSPFLGCIADTAQSFSATGSVPNG